MNSYEEKNVARVIERAMKVTTQRELAQDIAFLIKQLHLREDLQNTEEADAIYKKYGWRL